jgi:hypothetical protein
MQADTQVKRLLLHPCFLRRWGWLNVAYLCGVERSYNFVEEAMLDSLGTVTPLGRNSADVKSSNTDATAA